MAIIDDPTAYFQCTLYVGDGGGTRAVTNDGNSDLSPNWVWIKDRGTTSTHYIFDSVRGVQKHLTSAATTQELTDANSLKSFNSDGFTLGTSGNVNGNSRSFVSWNWKANGSGSLNEVGSIDSTVSANTTSGFSIATYTGTGSGATVGHGLGTTPAWVLVKERGASGESWNNFHQNLGAGITIMLNLTNAQQSSSTMWNNTAPTSSVFSVGADAGSNGSSKTYVAYCFAEKQGYSKFGSYTGNGNADGTFVYTGFKPAYVMVKKTSGTENWYIFDNKRSDFNLSDDALKANTNSAELADWGVGFDFLSNGFKARATDGAINASGGSYIYMAFAENPFVTSTANGSIPATAR